jgi:hypothetical protein
MLLVHAAACGQYLQGLQLLLLKYGAVVAVLAQNAAVVVKCPAQALAADMQ